MKILAFLSSEKLQPKLKGSITNKILESEQDKFFYQIFEYFPKLKLEEWTEKEIEIYAEKFMQIHSLRCKRCLGNKFCKKMELLLNLTEIL